MAYDSYEALRISVDRGIARATINHPPINLLDLVLQSLLDLVEPVTNCFRVTIVDFDQ